MSVKVSEVFTCQIDPAASLLMKFIELMVLDKALSFCLGRLLSRSVPEKLRLSRLKIFNLELVFVADSKSLDGLVELELFLLSKVVLTEQASSSVLSVFEQLAMFSICLTGLRVVVS